MFSLNKDLISFTSDFTGIVLENEHKEKCMVIEAGKKDVLLYNLDKDEMFLKKPENVYQSSFLGMRLYSAKHIENFLSLEQKYAIKNIEVYNMLKKHILMEFRGVSDWNKDKPYWYNDKLFKCIKDEEDNEYIQINEEECFSFINGIELIELQSIKGRITEVVVFDDFLRSRLRGYDTKFPSVFNKLVQLEEFIDNEKEKSLNFDIYENIGIINYSAASNGVF